MKEYYQKTINELVTNCNDMELLEIVVALLQKSQQA